MTQSETGQLPTVIDALAAALRGRLFLYAVLNLEDELAHIACRRHIIFVPGAYTYR